MPSFDVVSEVDKHELTNAIDQANRELATVSISRERTPSSNWKALS